MKHIKPFIGVGVFLLVIYVLWQLVPPYFHNYQFQSDVDEAAKEATYSYNKSDDDIRAEILKEAESDNVAITADQIEVNKTNASCSINVAYTVHVNLPVVPQDLHFSVSSENRNIMTR